MVYCDNHGKCKHNEHEYYVYKHECYAENINDKLIHSCTSHGCGAVYEYNKGNNTWKERKDLKNIFK